MSDAERKLTEPMLRHLRELVAVGPFWRPQNRGELACARALHRRGMLDRSYDGGREVYELNARGRAVVSP